MKIMIDKLISRIKTLNAPIVVGLDPTLEMIPEELKKSEICDTLTGFNREIIDAIYDIVPAVKPQIAMYERFGLQGLQAYIDTCQYAKEKGLIVIGDVKRSDIASTAAAYASHISDGPWPVDAVTLNPYLGGDSISPFTDVCAEKEKMIFVLVKTSNKGSTDLQDLKLQSGLTVYEHMADLVSEWGKELVGTSGYSKVGAVVGATFPEQGVALRKRMPNTFFLVPGYGAQGGAGKDLRGFFDKDGLGCIVNSSRGIIAAWQKDNSNVGDAARKAVIEMQKDLQEAI